ncbi:TetR family transcriptional regulator [Nonomuraea sp. NBC_01738]|uniref:TetR/AcrR family transcriptional regulator n=1 Tax=Nonomuraea sp. NBC_01738 TaxID=2976003 RepID=UPI002E0D4ACC|nr:TetR family transcriptional regulator [Nonomuraea sp. NBC_01738]
MSSPPQEGIDSADLTAQAKIRNAAVVHFARDGFGRTNLRAVAATAGVSAALVIRHFGSKDQLRDVCDEHVLRLLVRRARDVADPAGMREVSREYLSDPEEYRRHVQYMVRAIEEDRPAAATFVDTLVGESERILRAGIEDGSIRPSSDVRALAVLNVLISLSTMTMAPPLTRALGFDGVGPGLLQRIGLPVLELFTHGMYADDTTLKAVQAAWDSRAEGDE